MNAKRDRLQVIYDILKAISNKNGSIRPTHIIYKANLSSQMLNEYLKELLEGGFVVEHLIKKNKLYSLTDKGFSYLNEYKRINEFMDSFGLG